MPSGIQRPTSRRKLAVMINQATGLMNQLLGSLANSAGNSSKVFYVNNAVTLASDSASAGITAARPFSTIAYALTQCTANAGDVILVGPGHAETINAAGDLAVNVAGVSIIGTGVGAKRPVLTWATDTAATVTMTAANCRFSNFIFDMMLPSGLVSGIVISAAGCRIDKCLFKIGTGGGSNIPPVSPILTTTAADYLRVDGNMFVGPTATPGGSITAATGCISLVGGTGIVIEDNYFQFWGTTTSGAINNATTACHAYLIRNNVIINNTASATKGVVMHASSLGLTTNNRFGIGSGAAPITSAAGHWAGNWSAAAVATNGTLV